jgi:hypothetical protein
MKEWLAAVRAADWRVWVGVVVVFVGVPLLLAVLAVALVTVGPYGVVVGILGAAAAVFLAGLAHDWVQNWRAERRRLPH